MGQNIEGQVRYNSQEGMPIQGSANMQETRKYWRMGHYTWGRNIFGKRQDITGVFINRETGLTLMECAMKWQKQ